MNCSVKIPLSTSSVKFNEVCVVVPRTIFSCWVSPLTVTILFVSPTTTYSTLLTLYFDGIENVASYSVRIFKGSVLNNTKLVYNPSFEAKQLSLSLEDIVDSQAGAEYRLEIEPNIEGCNYGEGVNVFTSGATTLNYTVVGVANNLSIIN